MRNLLIHDLDKRAKVIKGFHKPLCMLQGLDDSFGAAVFVGYHSCAGTEGGGTLVMRGVEFGAAGLVLLFGVGLLFGYLAAERVTCF